PGAHAQDGGAREDGESAPASGRVGVCENGWRDGRGICQGARMIPCEKGGPMRPRREVMAVPFGCSGQLAYSGGPPQKADPTTAVAQRQMLRRDFLVMMGATLAATSLAVAGGNEVPTLLDHILLGCRDLDEGIAFVEKHAGVR